MPTRTCVMPRCPNPARPGKARCVEHYRDYERDRSRRRRAHPDRGRRVALYHSKKWLITRRAVLARDPICKVCDDRLSTQVDHVVPLSQGGEEWALDALQGICGPCHAAKSGRESNPGTAG